MSRGWDKIDINLIELIGFYNYDNVSKLFIRLKSSKRRKRWIHKNLIFNNDSITLFGDYYSFNDLPSLQQNQIKEWVKYVYRYRKYDLPNKIYGEGYYSWGFKIRDNTNTFTLPHVLTLEYMWYKKQTYYHINYIGIKEY